MSNLLFEFIQAEGREVHETFSLVGGGSYKVWKPLVRRQWNRMKCHQTTTDAKQATGQRWALAARSAKCSVSVGRASTKIPFPYLLTRTLGAVGGSKSCSVWNYTGCCRTSAPRADAVSRRIQLTGSGIGTLVGEGSRQICQLDVKIFAL
jgi:hypothetical protein